jgi:hypothetical protein
MVKKPKTGMVGSFLAMSACSPETTRLVEVPMTVQVPPSTVAKDRGMSSFLAGTLQRRDHDSRMGISSATMGVLFKKALETMTGSIMRWGDRWV